MERMAGQPTAVIAEDEPLLRAQLMEMLSAAWPELVVVAAVDDGLQAIRALEEHRPNVLFLDIQMPGLTGMEVARQASGRQHVVFVTAYDQHAVAAFEAGAVDYLVKPIEAPRLAIACSRLRERLRAAPADLLGMLKTLAAQSATRPDAYLRWINASMGNEVTLITVDEICYFQSDTKYTRVVMPDSEALIRRSIKELVGELDPTQFWQIHRGTLVNAASIRSVSRGVSGRVLIKLKDRSESLEVSRAFVHRFRQM